MCYLSFIACCLKSVMSLKLSSADAQGEERCFMSCKLCFCLYSSVYCLPFAGEMLVCKLNLTWTLPVPFWRTFSAHIPPVCSWLLLYAGVLMGACGAFCLDVSIQKFLDLSCYISWNSLCTFKDLHACWVTEGGYDKQESFNEPGLASIWLCPVLPKLSKHCYLETSVDKRASM